MFGAMGLSFRPARPVNEQEQVSASFCENNCVSTLLHLPYSLHLSLCDLRLLLTINQELKGHRFQSEEKLEGAAMDGIVNILIEGFQNFIGNWISPAHKCSTHCYEHWSVNRMIFGVRSGNECGFNPA